jgi:malate permease and related proteins
MIAWLLTQQIVVLFLMIGLGSLLVVFGLVKATDSRVLSLICIYLITPCVILKSFQINYTYVVRDGFLLAIIAAIAIHVILFFVIWLFSLLFHFDVVEKSSIIYSNSGNLIIPLVVSVLGNQWVIYASAFLCVQLFFIFTHCQSIMKGQTMLNFRRLFTNINLLSIIIGLIMFVSGVKIPKVPYEVVSSIAACIGPVSMIMLGMIMTSVNWRQVVKYKRLYLVTIMKMIVTPIMILFFLKYSGLSDMVKNGRMILLISLLAIITPSATIITQFAQIYHHDEQYAGSINAVTTLISIITMPLMIWIYLN